ncbi:MULTISPECIES: ABC transporter substrate-binding protein [unclassified Herbaspirillum]|jgi:NitT/TauT family transport system substrate-binding protein|uniref:ABC transporter substrate-binding protein n=1 Tax=unclassified Herbaspirillum TaxID=2624150 RepID=UPI000E2F91E3|nr:MULTISPECIES: ABC transporter substrate-binding protein [unclassified Herbaspirillum]RFB69838.1 ABC transporter substrate-binding protein [Herbaspirillum sp. 3R-3a1]TFI07097.1 ABC transporter substrate-binding protein [Herbaspirillum sp. 3R11]TFI13035.1 ABC transporter substrate-binding protein [Herbaspirillum sp. 3R-11]TFI23140.1 ABC transporter substrate-binding protein [Herbaspirillum sp. 3C11]
MRQRFNVCAYVIGTLFSTALISAAVLTVTAPAAQAADNKITIMVGGINKLIYLPPKLAENLGYFKDEGLDVELQSQQAGVDAENELLAGAVQAVVGYYDHSIDLQSKGKEVQSITQLLVVPGGMEMVRSDLATQVRSMADLKGRTLGVTGLGSSSSFLAQYLASRNGLKTSDYSMLPVGAGNTLIAALKQKRVDVVWTTEPTTSMLLASGEAKVLVDMNSAAGTRAALGGLYPASAVYVQGAWLKTHKPEAAKLARAFVRTLQYIQTHSAEEIAAKMPADYYGGNKALYVQALKASLPMYSPDGKMPAEGPEVVLKVMAAFNPNIKGKKIDLSKTYTNEFVNQVK